MRFGFCTFLFSLFTSVYVSVSAFESDILSSQYPKYRFASIAQNLLLPYENVTYNTPFKNLFKEIPGLKFETYQFILESESESESQSLKEVGLVLSNSNITQTLDMFWIPVNRSIPVLMMKLVYVFPLGKTIVLVGFDRLLTGVLAECVEVIRVLNPKFDQSLPLFVDLNNVVLHRDYYLDVDFDDDDNVNVLYGVIQDMVACHSLTL
jgi:hypothetical protein